jgi:hypothetical protein
MGRTSLFFSFDMTRTAQKKEILGDTQTASTLAKIRGTQTQTLRRDLLSFLTKIRGDAQTDRWREAGR